MPLLLAPVIGLLGIAIAMIRRTSQPAAPLDDMPARLLRWAIGLLSAERAQWGHAMLGELYHLDGRVRRWRFVLGCAGAALVLPPWGRAVAGAWALLAIAVGAVGVYAGMAIHYRLGVVDWLAVAVQSAVLTGLVLCCGALLRRPGVAVPGLLGGLVIAVTALMLSGFSFLDQIKPDTVPWHPWVLTVGAPIAVGAAGTLRTADPAVGKRIARLAAISGCLGLYLYWNIAVAAIGGGGPFDQDGGGTLHGTISDRLANNLILMLVILTVAATTGWGGAAATGALADRLVNPPGTTQSATIATSQEPEGPAIPARSWARSTRSVRLTFAITAAIILAAVAWLRG